MRTAEIKRKTAETDIELFLNIDGSGKSEINTGCGFLDHMLTLFSKHGRFDLTVKCIGDTEVDYHHSVEDIGIALGEAFSKALSDMRGIKRYADIILPMDESLILEAIDVSGRCYLQFDAELPTQKVGDFDTELAEEFFLGFTRKAGVTLHIKMLSGKNSHHIIEGIFKAFGRVMGAACAIDEKYSNEIPSTKGMLV
ncbi:MAG: imidazoleglycerol-phosphate dehydratase HisB [Ruminococcaceae bacterium]|nr:imidazoleglycerol-phosphate dehydratase HisB [Oscillospiraceae bacterium]